MARKTLNKMEFAQLIDTLKEQNQGQLEAQQQTTKSIRNLQAYFLKQDRADARRRLEDEMETRKDAEQVVGKKGKGLKGAIDATKGALRGKGLMGVFSNFLATGLLGSAGAGLFRSAIGALRFSPTFGMRMGKLFAGALVAPAVWDAVSKGLNEYSGSGDLSDAIAKGVVTLFKDDPGVSMLTGAGVGFATAGPKGAVAGAILGGAVSALVGGIGADNTENHVSSIGDLFSGPAGMAALAGIYGGKALMKQKIVKGKGLRLFGMRGMRVGLAALIIGPVLGAIEKGMKPTEGDAGISSKISKFLFSTDQGGISTADAALTGLGLAALGPFGIPGMIAGAVLGLAYKAVDDGMRSKTAGAGIMDVTSDAIGSFFRKLDLGIAAFFGDDRADEILENMALKESRMDFGESLLKIGQHGDKGTIGDLFQQFRKDNKLSYDSSSDKSVDEQTHEAFLKFLSGSQVARDKGILKTDATGKSSLDLGSLQGADLQETQALLKSFIGAFAKEQGVEVGGIETRGYGKTRFMSGFQPLISGIGRTVRNETEAKKELEAKGVVANARGAQVYRKPTLALVAEKPGTAEYIMSDRNLARLADTIATQRENQTMTSMIPIMMGQGGGTSMPVINNSYSYQNTENSVREMPTTSSLNMMTALA